MLHGSSRPPPPARAVGLGVEHGLDAMVDVATVLLNGVSFEGVGSCHVTSATALYADGFADDDLALAQIDFSIKFTSNPGVLKLITPADFEALGITWVLDGAEDEGPADEIHPPQEED